MAEHRISGFVSTEWKIIQVQAPDSPQNACKDDIRALCLSVAAQIPGGRYLGPSILCKDQQPAAKPATIEERMSDLQHIGSQHGLNVVFCEKVDESSPWKIHSYVTTNEGPIVLVCVFSTTRPKNIEDIVMGFQGMSRTTTGLHEELDPLPFCGLAVDDASVKLLKQTLERVAFPPSIGPVKSSRSLLKHLEEDEINYKKGEMDPQDAAFDKHTLRCLTRHWMKDVEAGTYRPRNAWAFHWFGWLSLLDSSQKDDGMNAKIGDGFTRLETWALWDKRFFEASVERLRSCLGPMTPSPRWNEALVRMQTKDRRKSHSVPSVLAKNPVRALVNPTGIIHAKQLTSSKFAAADPKVVFEYAHLLDTMLDYGIRVAVCTFESEIQFKVINLEETELAYTLVNDVEAKSYKLSRIAIEKDTVSVDAYWYPSIPSVQVLSNHGEMTKKSIQEGGTRERTTVFENRQLLSAPLPNDHEPGFVPTLLLFIMRAMTLGQISPMGAVHPTAHSLCVDISERLEGFNRTMMMEILAGKIGVSDKDIPVFLQEDE